jgi:hypothetical protein
MINSIGSATGQPGSTRPDTGKTQQQPKPAAEPTANPAQAKVDEAHSQVAYSASLDALRSANKKMMGYLLNIKV